MSNLRKLELGGTLFNFKERETETDRETERDRDRQTDRQTDREKEERESYYDFSGMVDFSPITPCALFNCFSQVMLQHFDVCQKLNAASGHKVSETIENRFGLFERESDSRFPDRRRLKFFGEFLCTSQS